MPQLHAAARRLWDPTRRACTLWKIHTHPTLGWKYFDVVGALPGPTIRPVTCALMLLRPPTSVFSLSMLRHTGNEE